MKVRFATEHVTEFAEGPLYFKNEGQDIEVSQELGRELLTRRYAVDGSATEFANVFVKAESSKADGNVADSEKPSNTRKTRKKKETK